MASAAEIRLLQEAAASFQSGAYDSALARCEAVLASSPREPEALHLRALTLGKLGRIDEAIAAFESAHAAHPRKDAILSNKGNLLAGAGRRDEAIDAYRRALAVNPNFFDGWFNLASSLKASGDRRGAEDALRRALALNPRSAKALNNLGLVLQDTDRPEEAIAAYSQALLADPRYPPALVNRGKLRMTRREHDEAQADLSAAAALDPRAPGILHDLANAYRMAARFPEAEAAFRRALALAPGDRALHADFANMLWELGRADDFLTLLDHDARALRSAELLSLSADMALRAGHVAAADQKSADLIALDPSRAASFSLRSRLLRHLGRREDAAAEAARAFQLAPDDFERRLDLVEALLVNGAIDDAWRLFDATPPPSSSQRFYALKATAMRAMGDDAYRYYFDYDRLTAKMTIETPPGYESLAAFNAALMRAIEPLHRKSTRPIDQTLFGGTQSLGRLWEERDETIKALSRALLAAAQRFVAGLPDDPAHPFLSIKSPDLRCEGAWSIVLASGGGHVDHIHPKGRISASYYVKVPAEIGGGERAGCLRLGASGVAGFALPAERWIRPEEGSVIFFPSYIWHGVEPFEAATPRVTAPFDLAFGASEPL